MIEGVSTRRDNPTGADPAPLQPCSDADRASGDDPLGSATAFGSFLLLDYRRPWSRVAADDAVRDLLDPVAGARLTDRSHPGALRAFATRPVRDRRDTPAVPPRAGRVGPDPLLTVLPDVPGPDGIARIRAGRPPGRATDEIIVGVCTNAKRDRCCAVRGRPVATALYERFGSTVTEISHLGGHRFAATMLVLPSGYSYGLLDPATAGTIVMAALDGLVHPLGLRGRADLSAPAQAADAHWRRALGPAPVSAVRIEQIATEGIDSEVTATVAGSTERVHVRRVAGPTIGATACSSTPIPTGTWSVTAA